MSKIKLFLLLISLLSAVGLLTVAYNKVYGIGYNAAIEDQRAAIQKLEEERDKAQELVSQLESTRLDLELELEERANTANEEAREDPLAPTRKPTTDSLRRLNKRWSSSPTP